MRTPKIRLFFSLLLILLMAACMPDSAAEMADDQADTAQIATTAVLPTGDKPAAPAFDIPETAEIRVYNGTGQTLDSVSLTFANGSESFGRLEFGQFSDYRPVDLAHPYPAVNAVAGADLFQLAAREQDDFDPLPAGRFTFELSLANGTLQLGVIDDYPLLTDARYMAEDMGIPLEEALAQLAGQDAIGTLNAQLEANEAATFAGLWIEREPEYRVVVAFTEDGEATMAPYIAGTELADIVVVQPAARSLAELRQIQANVSTLLAELNFPAASAVSVQTNQVELYITDEARFNDALAEAGAAVPEGVQVVVMYEPAAERPVVTPVPGVFMPQLTVRSPGFMEALLIGTLTVEDGCLLARQENGDRRVIIWQPEYYLSDQDGAIVILDRDGAVAATVGEPIYLGGGEVGSVDQTQLQAPLAAACQGGPYWLMGEFLPEEYIPNVTE